MEWKVMLMVLVIWPRWPSCLYILKLFKNCLIKNQKANDLGSWYEAYGIQGWSWPSLWQGQICSIMHLYGKSLSQLMFLITIKAEIIILARHEQTNETKVIDKYQRSNWSLTFYQRSLIMSCYIIILTYGSQKPMDIQLKFHMEYPFNETFFIWLSLKSHDKNGRHAHIKQKPFNIFFYKHNSPIWPICCIEGVRATNLAQMMILCWPWPILLQGQTKEPVSLWPGMYHWGCLDNKL